MNEDGIKWHDAAALDEIPDMMPRKVEVGGRSMLLCKSGGEVYAVDEMCPHKYESMAYGVIFQGRITCPHHQYAFDLETGRCNKRRCEPVQTYRCEVRDSRVFIGLPG